MFGCFYCLSCIGWNKFFDIQLPIERTCIIYEISQHMFLSTQSLSRVNGRKFIAFRGRARCRMHKCSNV